MALREKKRNLLSNDYWPYGLERNRKVLETFLRYHYEQGILKKKWEVDNLFAPETLTQRNAWQEAAGTVD